MLLASEGSTLLISDQYLLTREEPPLWKPCCGRKTAGCRCV